MSRRTIAWAGAVTAALLLAAVLTPASVNAHAEYQRSNLPADGTVAAVPARLDVWFTQELFRRTGENRLTVIGPDGQPAHAGDAVIDDADRTHLSVSLKSGLRAGTYTVTWATLSAQDGENAEGQFIFRVDPAATPTSAPAASATGAVSPTAPPPVTTPALSAAATATALPLGAAPGEQFPWWALGGAVAILLSGGIVAGTILRGERRP